MSGPDLPDVAEDLIREGDRLRDKGRFAEAMACYQRLIARAPSRPEGHYKLGTVHSRAGRNAEAEQCYRQALAMQRGYPGALNNLALLCFAASRFDEAERLYREILANETDYFEAHINLGNLLVETGRSDEALFYFRRATELRPDSAVAHERLGGILRSYGRVVDALEHIGRALEIDPRSAVAWNNLGACHFVRGEHAAADRAFAESLALDENQDAAWNNLAFLSNLMTMDRDAVFQRHRTFGEWMRRRCGPASAVYPQCSAEPERRLRVGFVSGDLRHHSVAYFLRGFLAQLDRTGFETWAYSTIRKVDDMTSELRPLFQHWRDIFDLADTAAVDAIRGDRIDILIDLAGHTSNNRLVVFAFRPAPVQISWIGYPATTGLDSIDYRLTDAVADPGPDDDRYHTEALWRLPGPFLCFSPPVAAPTVSAAPSQTGVPITFGSFNARVKLGEECLSLWARVLAAMPEARLLVKSINGVEEAEAREQLVAEFVRHGVAADRVEVLSSLPSTAEHLAQYHRVDIALDAFPYHGTTTTCEALWMGVPVVTLAGDRHVSRVGASLLTHVGLPELVAHSPEAFVTIARDLARSPERLMRYRADLRDQLRRSPLLDAESMARRFESAMREMWRRYCASDAARAAGADADADGAAEKMKLHIGGRQVQEGWKILDVQAGEGVDYVGDIRALDDFDDECCEEIYCSHVLQALPVRDIVPALTGLHRLLVSGGKLLISVPDFDVLTALFQRSDLDMAQRFQIMRMVFGGQMDEFDFHRAGLNFDFLVGYLAQAGFSGVEQVESFDLFADDSGTDFEGAPISLNVVVTK
jgi:predicted O-linked N-acetylglucosamine transferase (SPINDLY family)/predicted SAM-dependent methyltransferase